jgi:hypothetical protein
MRRNTPVQHLMLALAINLVPVGALQQSAAASAIDGNTYAMAAARSQHVDGVRAFLAREDVRAELVRHGVDPGAAAARVATLTDAELAQLAGRIDTLPAGGDAVAIIGAVFLVLLVLEVVGVTDVFKGI